MRIPGKFLAVIPFIVLMLAAGKPRMPVVKLTSHKGKAVSFVIRRPKLEWVNGALNLSLLSADNKLIQLNGISESLLTDTTFRSASVSYLLIDSNRTFMQSKRLLPLIEIECREAEPGKPVFIRAHGRVYHNRIWYTATIEYTGMLPRKTFNTPQTTH